MHSTLNLNNKFSVYIFQTSIYPPNHEVPTPGAMFHVIMRHADSNQLSTYLTRLYKPTKVRRDTILLLWQLHGNLDCIMSVDLDS